jgi:N-methylhydantoinase B
MWGVALTDAGGVDLDATRARRQQLRDERRSVAAGPSQDGAPGGPWSPAEDGIRLSESLFYERGERGLVYRCRCGHVLGPADLPYKQLAAQARFGVQRIGPEVNPHGIGGARFELREFYCPGCYTLLEVEIARPADPVLDDARLAISP